MPRFELSYAIHVESDTYATAVDLIDTLVRSHVEAAMLTRAAEVDEHDDELRLHYAE